jgi:putative CocE/NonD family hydrolase
MKYLLLSLVVLLSNFCSFAQNTEATDEGYMRTHYDQFEYHIPMRDGRNLFTLVYIPKDKTQAYPILLNRTCYNASAKKDFKTGSHPSRYLVRDGYIFAFQDVRGRYLSEGTFDNMRPNIPGNDVKNRDVIDESSDTWDTIDWMIKNIKRHNGKVGMYGISYPGFYTTAALPDAHPALITASPQAPIADFFFDDFHHMGAFLQSYTGAYPVFGYQKSKLTTEVWYEDKLKRLQSLGIKDGYDFFLDVGPLKNITEKYLGDNFFWNQTVEHPNYDEFWKKRNILPHLKNVKQAVMTVGGWFDAEDLYGPLHIYKKIESSSPSAYNIIVMGPWGHGDWSQEKGKSIHNHIYFGDSISTFYMREIERPFFAYHLKGKGTVRLPEAYMFDTGKNVWKKFETWPPKDAEPLKLYFSENGRLLINRPVNTEAFFEYVSDPAKPVPYTSEIEGITHTPRKFMSDDQRDASRRPDVLTFETEVLTEDVTVAGEIMAKLKVSLSSTDADFIVKFIDVYPQNYPSSDHNPDNIIMGGYQQLVRHEVFRGRFRNSFEKPEPFKPNEATDVSFPLQDILHTFKRGHKMMIQIHSTWFPYIDRNPQKYVDNIYKADEADFIKAIIKVWGSSVIEVGGEQGMNANLDFSK